MSSAEIDGKPGSPFIEFFTVEQAATATYLPVQRLEPDPGGTPRS